MPSFSITRGVVGTCEVFVVIAPVAKFHRIVTSELNKFFEKNIMLASSEIVVRL